MSRLDDFLNLQDVSSMEEEIYINERLGNFKIKPLSGAKNEEFRKRCTTKNGTDINKFQILVVSEQVIDPDFSNSDFLAKTGCQTAREFIERKFKAGEIATIANKILDISGFNIDINEKIEEAKN